MTRLKEKLRFKKQATRAVIGGVIMVYWPRAGKCMQRYREATNNPKIGEWSEWLVDQIIARRARAKHGPAHILYRNWRE